ncbi:MAG: uracil-DNA glycosylase family protein [Alphaproteobacteria bacterium]
MAAEFEALLAEIRACTICAGDLPLGPRPVLRASPTARVMIVGQAPGTRVHQSGVPWDDPSGKRLRQWLGLEAETFYDEARIAIVPSGFCYPGRHERGGDLPPRPECAPRWHPPLLAAMPDISLTLLVGQYAQANFLGKRRKRTLTETVRAWRDYLPQYVPTPHPSWRSTNWLKKNPWFETEILPEIRQRLHALL